MFVVLSDQRGKSKPLRTRVSGTPWKLNGCPMTYFTITRTYTGYVAAWPTKGQVYFVRLDKDGAVLPPGEIRTPGESGMRNGLVALSASDGATLVAWKNKDRLGWQLYDAKSQPQERPARETAPEVARQVWFCPTGTSSSFCRPEHVVRALSHCHRFR